MFDHKSNLAHSNFDDGGANKNDSRRRRRRLKNALSKIVVAISGCMLFIIVYQFHTRSQTRNGIREDHSIVGLKLSRERLLERFQNVRGKKNNKKGELKPLPNHEVQNDPNRKPKYRWTDPMMLPTPPNSSKKYADFDDRMIHGDIPRGKMSRPKKDLVWESEIDDGSELPGPKVDYTKLRYEYPENILIPERGGSYPPMEPLGDLMKRWPQDDIDLPPQPFRERLQHFDYLDPVQMEAAVKYRNLEFPFKVYNVPEVEAASKKWTDEYLSFHFDRIRGEYVEPEIGDERIPPTRGHCQQSVDSFFAFYNQRRWNTKVMGPPPTVDNDMTFKRFAKHARYADAVGLAPNEEHFYWQAGVQRTERLLPKSKWGFISRDLPSFSDPNPTFFGFNPPEQNGIQCRLGERGVAAATHYDGGRNMIAMVTGAKRYILSPPVECGKLGIVPSRKHPIYRHSLLNFGHINALNSDDPEVDEMSSKEREWLEASKSALAIETVLKAGEVLYCPSHWFHYIISLQKSAQCNTRSGKNIEGSPEWGGAETVEQCSTT